MHENRDTAASPQVAPPNLQPGGVFIAWHAYSRRAQLLSDKFGLKLCLVHSLRRRYFLAPLRYLLQAVQTLRILVKERPRLIFVQSPPVFAPLVVMLYASLVNARVIIDAHSGALLAPWWRWSLPLHASLSRRAVTTIVTNKHLLDLVLGWGANSFIVADIPAVFPTGIAPAPTNGFKVVVINTFSPDEPLAEVLKAAADLPELAFFVTGDPNRAKLSLLQRHPRNVQFTGFLPDQYYVGLLRSADGIMALTTHDHTMQRGACEAVSLGLPIITSDWPILRAYFDKGTIYVDNTVEGIRQGLLRLRAEHVRLRAEIATLQEERRQEWCHKHTALVEMIERGCPRLSDAPLKGGTE